jgi:hypothetical protein
MYTRSPQGRFPRDLRVPRNYAGNAFRPPLSEKENETPIFIDEDINEYEEQEQKSDSIMETSAAETTEEVADKKEEKGETKQTGLFSFPKFDLGLGKLFSRGGINIGFEELLILGLILLIASEGKGDDLILLLILLLFIQ